jgi:hypothetical protein
MRPNGESDSIDVNAIRIIPTITATDPIALPVGVPTPITITGTNFVPGITVDLEGAPATPSNITATSFDTTLTALASAALTLTVTRPSGEFATRQIAGGGRVVFTTAAVAANLGGALAGDAVCASAASAASLPGTFMAWLSDSTTDPATRFTQAGGPYVRPDGTLIADDWADLTDGTLSTSISTQGISAWTATSPAGVWLNNGQDCQEWTSTSAGVSGARGLATSTSSNWTQVTPAIPCSGTLVLYCFEQ